MTNTLPYRVVKLEDAGWTIRPDGGELDPEEQRDLRAHLDAIGLPYHLHHGRLCLAASLVWEALYESLRQFYAGRAEISPF